VLDRDLVVVVGQETGHLQCWDVAKRVLLVNEKVGNGGIAWIEVCGGELIAAASIDGAITVIDIRSGLARARFHQEETIAHFQFAVTALRWGAETEM
jgi:hypothetical protein